MPLLLLSLLACDRSEDVKTDPLLLGADGVTVTQVTITQGPERVLAVDGEAQESDVPLVAGRDALVRVFYTADDGVGELVTGRLELASGSTWDVEAERVEESDADDLGTTLNFTVPGDEISDSFEYRVSILAEGTQDNADAHFPQEGLDAHTVEGDAPVFKLVLVPYAYDYDDSGRIPDVSDEAIASYVQRFRQLYPVADVQVTVHDPVPWAAEISPTGQGWQEVGLSLYGLRAREGADADTYYYGMFNPSASVDRFCQRGCLLGVTLLNDSPSDVGNPDLRLALGVGFPEVVEDTMLHELGHAHGRSHAPCGVGVDPNSIDRSFPNNDGAVDGLTWDLVGGELVTGMTDLMGYCTPQWTSAYTYTALHTRMVNIQGENSARSASAEAALQDILLVDGHGGARWAGTQTSRADAGGQALWVKDANGQDVQGRLFRYDHLPGGWLFLPRGDMGVGQVSFELDGRSYRVMR